MGTAETAAKTSAKIEAFNAAIQASKELEAAREAVVKARQNDADKWSAYKAAARAEALAIAKEARMSGHPQLPGIVE